MLVKFAFIKCTLSNNHQNIKTIGLATAIFIAIANMIGTGVFTSLGYQVVGTHTVFALIMLWVVGGIVALCGALCYAELGAALPRSGGEYHLLSVIYHPSIGFLAGWVSLVAGFAAPTALAAMSLSKYTQVVFTNVPVAHIGALVVILLMIIHSVSIKAGSHVQNFFTILKIAVIIVFIFFGLAASKHQSVSLYPTKNGFAEMLAPTYFISLVYVSFAYTGWNAAIYFVSELRNLQRNLPKALFFATLLVLFLYALLNYVFLYVVPQANLSGKIEIGFITATQLFGSSIGRVVSICIALLMVSTIGAMVFVGGRITQAMGEDYRVLSILGKRTIYKTPMNAIIFQGIITLLFIYSSTFEQVIVYTSFTMILINNLTVFGIIILRIKQPNLPRPFKVWGYPFVPILFLLINVAIMFYVCIEKPKESLIGFGIICAGLLLYFLNGRFAKK